MSKYVNNVANLEKKAPAKKKANTKTKSKKKEEK